MKTCIQKISLLFVLAVSGLIVNAQTIAVSATVVIGGSPYTQAIANGGNPFDQSKAFDATIAGDLKQYLPITITIKNTSTTTALTLTKNGNGKYITLGNTGASDFTIDEAGITSSTIEAGASETFTVGISSSATNGANKIVTLGISNNDPVNGSFEGGIKYTLTSIATALTKASDIGLSLYPNPSADGHFFITANNVAVEKVVVANVSGITQEFAGQEFTTSLKGLLLVQVYTDKGIVSEKVIIQE